MNEKEFIEGLYESIIKENERLYSDLFNHTEIEEVTDLYWKDALKLYKGLSADDKNVFFEIIKQIEIDTISNLLGILDGGVSLENKEVDLKLSLTHCDKSINGNLQEVFLEYDEERRK